MAGVLRMLTRPGTIATPEPMSLVIEFEYQVFSFS
jgi:hypothetical protein